MKIATIFTEKGGMGKTTITTLFASWLAYSEREDVSVLDLDAPSFQLSSIRKQEEKLLAGGAGTLASLASPTPYPIVRVGQERTAEEVIQSLKTLKEAAGGYVLLDFGGNYRTSDISYKVIQSGVVDRIIIPMDSDRQSRDAALYLIVSTRDGIPGRGKEGQPLAVLWNRETGTERSSGGRRYAVIGKELELLGVPVISGRIREITIARRDSDTFGFIRSTLCWPETNIRMRCPWLVDIFREMKDLIDNS